jgi:hypothetical protein
MINRSKQLEYYYNNKAKIQERTKPYFKKYYEDNKDYFKKIYQDKKASGEIIIKKEEDKKKEDKPSVIFTTEKIEISLD